MSAEKRVLLVISGGIAAYKSLDLIRRLRERNIRVRCVLTQGGAQFVTPLSLSALSEEKVYSDIFSLTDEAEMGHIQLSRSADLLVVVPATADILARMAAGLANDLATTVLLATDKPVMFVPAMNVRMWEHAATRANVETLVGRGLIQLGPELGNMACGEHGLGRMAEPTAIVAAIEDFFTEPAERPLAGRRALITSGPTREAIDPVRYLSNHSSGKQGHAIAAALAGLGAETALITGPVELSDPAGVKVVRVESAADMLAACQSSLPVDVAVCAAAVSDWRVAAEAPEKLKKDGSEPPVLELMENPDILKTLCQAKNRRPGLVVGFAAETEKVIERAVEKRRKKGCDWILANDVSAETGTFGGDSNRIHFVHVDGVEDWPLLTKQEVAACLAERIVVRLGESE
ncbi:MAG: Coenzyme A biosynthesis bifunctional protein CoaBC [Alphaproteobacteria bacterium MarineAlpha4_Bin2]|nr:MAG: Coenzyme A biosynthesis bifunctional protein CoaBC [Alphaproteobacteria bacterium MarineAlpha4_Bin2]